MTSVNVEKIVSGALSLPPTLRAYVAEKLIESLDAAEAAPLSPAWRQEVQRRCDEIDRGVVELRDGEEVFARAFARLG